MLQPYYYESNMAHVMNLMDAAHSFGDYHAPGIVRVAQCD